MRRGIRSGVIGPYHPICEGQSSLTLLYEVAMGGVGMGVYNHPHLPHLCVQARRRRQGKPRCIHAVDAEAVHVQVWR